MLVAHDAHLDKCGPVDDSNGVGIVVGQMVVLHQQQNDCEIASGRSTIILKWSHTPENQSLIFGYLWTSCRKSRALSLDWLIQAHRLRTCTSCGSALPVMVPIASCTSAAGIRRAVTAVTKKQNQHRKCHTRTHMKGYNGAIIAATLMHTTSSGGLAMTALSPQPRGGQCVNINTGRLLARDSSSSAHSYWWSSMCTSCALKLLDLQQHSGSQNDKEFIGTGQQRMADR